jgi:hypothetical protein
MGLAVLNSNVYQLGIFWLLGCREDEGGVGCGILRLVFADSCVISIGGELKSQAII